MDTESFLSHVSGHAGVPPDRAERTTRSVLAGLASTLAPSERALVADELPEDLASAFEQPDAGGLAAALSSAHGRELVASVCRVLGEELSTSALAILRDAAPGDLADWLATPSEEMPRQARSDTTLAAGRPGSLHPVSESGGQVLGVSGSSKTG